MTGAGLDSHFDLNWSRMFDSDGLAYTNDNGGTGWVK